MLDKKEVGLMSAISLWIDGYEDIFSDFDPRPYSQRIISDDFLFEAKRAVRETSTGKIELKLLIPENKRNKNQESIIKKRLKDSFHKQYHNLQKEKKNIIKKGIAFAITGIILMFLATFILVKYPEEHFFLSFLIVLLEPAGWFTFWEGLNLVIFDSKEKKQELEFNKKMSKCIILFLPY